MIQLTGLGGKTFKFKKGRVAHLFFMQSTLNFDTIEDNGSKIGILIFVGSDGGYCTTVVM